MINTQDYEQDLINLIEQKNFKDYISAFSLIFSHLKEKSEIDSFIILLLTLENKYQVYLEDEVSTYYSNFLLVIRKSILRLLNNGILPPIEYLYLYMIFNRFDISTDEGISVKIDFFKNDITTLEWDDENRFKENDIIFLLDILNNNSKDGFTNYIKRILLSYLKIGVEKQYLTFLRDFCSGNDIPIEYIHEAVEYNINKKRYFDVHPYQRRSILAWTYELLHNFERYSLNIKSQKLYPALKKLHTQHLMNKDIEDVMYLEFFILWIVGGTFNNQKEWEEFNFSIAKPSSELYSKYSRDYKLEKVKFFEKEKIKIAFLFERLANLSPFKVIYALLKNLKNNSDFNEKYEVSIYSLNYYTQAPKYQETLQLLEDIDVPLITPVESYLGLAPYASRVERALKIRESFIDNNIDIAIANFNNYDILSFLFASRIAPKQVYWSHGGCQYDIIGIDSKISHFEQKCEDKEFNIFRIPFDEQRYNPTIDKNTLAQVLDKFPKDKFILGSIGRLIKINSDSYLNAIAKIMLANPNTIYLACGVGNQEEIGEKLKKLGIFDRFYFTGMIDPHIYGNIIDLFLSPFPLGGGEALEEYRSKGKPYVAMHSTKWAQERQKIDFQEVYTNNDQRYIKKDLYTDSDLECINKNGYLIQENKSDKFYETIGQVVSEEDYVSIANKLINDKELREKTGTEFLSIKNYYYNHFDYNNFTKVING